MTQIILKTIKELKEWRLSNQKGLNFVPSMGNLHLGHEELIREAKKLKENLVLLSIFINPLQFNDKEDLRNYPRTINKDIDLAFAAGADAIFIPSVDEIFPKSENKINYLKASEDLSNTLCGISRKGHFDGVCTVVNRLINIVEPEIIFLGEKKHIERVRNNELLVHISKQMSNTNKFSTENKVQCRDGFKILFCMEL